MGEGGGRENGRRKGRYLTSMCATILSRASFAGGGSPVLNFYIKKQEEKEEKERKRKKSRGRYVAQVSDYVFLQVIKNGHHR